MILVALLPGATPIGRVDVGIDNVRSAKGVLRFCVTADPANFPDCTDDARAVTRVVPAAVHQLVFDGLPYGQYGIAVIHDENDNDRLDRFAGIPREGFGFSRNPGLHFGLPPFTAVRFTVDGDASKQQIGLKYLL